MRRDSAALIAPTLLGASRNDVSTRRRPELTLRVSGRVWKAVFADVNALRWNDTAAVYRPKYQTRSELFVQTSSSGPVPKGKLWIAHFCPARIPVG